jgi:hypothetical protein
MSGLVDERIARLNLNIGDFFVETLRGVFKSSAWRPGIWAIRYLLTLAGQLVRRVRFQVIGDGDPLISCASRRCSAKSKCRIVEVDPAQKAAGFYSCPADQYRSHPAAI